MDVVDPEIRSRMMSGIRGKNTKPELVIRKGLHRQGFRFRLHVSTLAGKPDIVLPKYGVVVFVNGCFWHGHSGCKYFKLPSTRIDFWRNKIEKNIQNDARSIKALIDAQWRIAIVWECALNRRSDTPPSELLENLSTWIRTGKTNPIVEFTSSGGPFLAKPN